MDNKCSMLPGGARICIGDMNTNTVVLDTMVVDASLPPSRIQARPRLLLITHGHADHFRYAYQYRERGAIIAVPRHCLALVENPAINQMATIGWAGPIDEEHITRYFVGRGVRADRLLDPGRIAESVTALAAPGHTPGHLAYILETRDARILAAGDTVLGEDYLEKTPLPYHTNTVWLKSTLKHFKELDIDVLVPGHGEPATGKREAARLIDRNLNHLEKALKLVETLLPEPDEEPVYPDEIVARLAEKLGYTKSKRAYSALSPTTRALLLALRHEKRAEAIPRRGVLAWRKKDKQKTIYHRDKTPP